MSRLWQTKGRNGFTEKTYLRAWGRRPFKATDFSSCVLGLDSRNDLPTSEELYDQDT